MGLIIQGQTIFRGRTIIGDPIPGVLLGYRAASSVSFINDWGTTFMANLPSVPIYARKSSGWTFGQIPSAYSRWVTGNPFFEDIQCTTNTPTAGGQVYGITNVSGGAPGYQIRLASSTSYNGSDGANLATSSPWGYYVTSATKVNVGSTNRVYIPTFYATQSGAVPFLGQEMYANSSFSWITNTTIAWAALPNVTATHLLTFTGGSYVDTIA